MQSVLIQINRGIIGDFNVIYFMKRQVDITI